MNTESRFKKHRPKQANDLGFGTHDHGFGRRSLNRDGSFNVVRKGVPFFNTFETYHRLISMPWLRFNLYVLFLYFIINFIFACLYYIAGIDNLAGIAAKSNADKFWEAFFFSAQTLTTVGYGRVSPVGNFASTIAAIESMLGLLAFALATGLLYGRFSRPDARIKFSTNALISPYKNVSALLFRIVNERRNQLIEVEAALSLSMLHDKHSNTRTFHTLKLERDKINFFPLSWTIVHPIDEHSPLWGLSEKEFREKDIEVIALIKAFDDTFSQTIYTRLSYKDFEVVWGAKFIPMTEFTNNGTLLYLNKIDLFEKVESFNPKKDMNTDKI